MRGGGRGDESVIAVSFLSRGFYIYNLAKSSIYVPIPLKFAV